MGRSQRVKGTGFERYIVNLFKQQGYETAKRNLQFQQKNITSADISVLVGDFDLIIECKKWKECKIVNGYRQAKDKVRKENDIACVVSRDNYQDILITFEFDSFIKLIKDSLVEDNDFASIKKSTFDTISFLVRKSTQAIPIFTSLKERRIIQWNFEVRKDHFYEFVLEYVDQGWKQNNFCLLTQKKDQTFITLKLKYFFELL